MSTPQLIIALITFFLTFASGLSFAVWTLSNKISDNTRTITSHVVETRVELNTKISSLDKGLAVLQTSVNQIPATVDAAPKNTLG